MKALTAIAKQVVLELFHEKLFLVLLLFSVLSVLMSSLMGQLTYTQADKITLDFMLGMSDAILLFLSVGLPAMMLHREFFSGSIYLTLSQPVSRTRWLVGKLIGLWFTLFLLSILFTSILIAVQVFNNHEFSWISLFQFWIYELLKCFLLCSISLFFATRLPVLMAMALSLSTYVLSFLVHHNEGIAPPGLSSTEALSYLTSWVPKFHLLENKMSTAYGTWAALSYSLWTVGYATVCIFLFSLGACILFERREIT